MEGESYDKNLYDIFICLLTQLQWDVRKFITFWRNAIMYFTPLHTIPNAQWHMYMYLRIAGATLKILLDVHIMGHILATISTP